MSATTCEACGGYRLKPEALRGQDRAAGTSARSPSCRSRDAAAWFAGAAGAAHRQAAGDRARASSRRSTSGWASCAMSGLGYLTLARDCGTLSGGESQRIRLASQIGSGLTGVLYVLDEPSIGLHQRDNDRLLETLQEPARPRQHGDRGRARRGGDPRGRPRGRHGAGRRRAWRHGRRRGHAGRGHGGAPRA